MQMPVSPYSCFVYTKEQTKDGKKVTQSSCTSLVKHLQGEFDDFRQLLTANDFPPS